MKKLVTILIALTFSTAIAEEMFFNGENIVGYIKDTKGNKYLILQTPEGKAKLIKTNKDPKQIMKDAYGITKQDFEEIK